MAETYTKLEYIQSTGTQFINSEYAPSNNTRIVMDVHLEQNTDYPYIFGVWTEHLSNMYSVYYDSATSWTVDYGTNRTVTGFTDWNKRQVFDFGGNKISIGGSTVTLTAVTFSQTYYLYLLAHNSAGSAVLHAKAKLYSCQIYDNGTFVRDFVPAKRNSDGAIGLLDQANNVFYGNAGTGTFTAGPEIVSVGSLANIDGTSVLLTGCIANVGGIEYAIPYALANVDGIEVVVPFGEAYKTIDVVPYQTGTLTYTGSALTPTWAGYDESTLIIGGTTSATNAGTYTATFTPADGYVWADTMEAETRSVNWAIGKAAGKVTLSKTSISLTAGGSTTFTVSRSGDGTIVVSSSATGRATATLSGTTVTVKGVSSGSATITVTVAEGTNHLAASATCSVYVTSIKYTVTIEKQSNFSPSNAYFEINGTKYDGNTAYTLSVESGTKWNTYTANGTGGSGTYVNNVNQGTGAKSGTVTSNIKVGVSGQTDYATFAIFTIYITTS